MSDDPTESSLWRELHQLLRTLDADILSLYADRGLPGFRSRYAMPVIRIHHRGPLTIRQLAEALGVTHSAMSQTVRDLVKLDLVTVAAGVTDGRTRLVSLSSRGCAEVAFMESEWRATEASLADLEAETAYPLSRLAGELKAALGTKPFRDRILANIEKDKRG